MNKQLSWIITVLLVFGHVTQVCGEQGGAARSVLLSLDLLDVARQRWLDGDVQVTRDIASLTRDADLQLTAGPYSVVFSDIVAPSGDPHDYVSYAPYAWPNPDTPDGIPWISRDGHINPDNLVDNRALCQLGRAVESLSLAYYFTEDEKYAEKAADLIRVWFLDEETYMNPKNEYATLKPRADGTFFGGTYNAPNFANCTPMTIDAAAMLESSAHWTPEDAAGLKQWTRDFITWADGSSEGQKQFNEPSNHGTNYDLVKALFSLYSGDLPRAKESMEHYLWNRLPGQMDPDGSNPLEMKRANNMQYHRYNLSQVNDLAWLSRWLDDVDMFAYEMEDGRNLRLGLDFLLPYFLGEPWDKFSGERFQREPTLYYGILRRAAVYYQDPLLLDAADSLGYATHNYVNLTHPRAAVAEVRYGDFDADGHLSVADLDLMAERTNASAFFARFDLDGNHRLDLADREIWVSGIYGTGFGDTDLDGRFNSNDLIRVFVAGKYRIGVQADATWAEGDWNGDQLFNEDDLLLAFQHGHYEASRPLSVPEPCGAVILSIGLLLTVARLRFSFDSGQLKSSPTM